MQGNGDYISREAATTLFARACGECKEACEEFDGFYADCNQCLLHGVLKELPTIPAADVVPVVRGHKVTHNRPIAGYWAEGLLDGGWNGMEGRVWIKPIMDNPVDYCSECGKRLDDRFQNYCPNCGAKMEG